jgi:hypothetical protein
MLGILGRSSWPSLGGLLQADVHRSPHYSTVDGEGHRRDCWPARAIVRGFGSAMRLGAQPAALSSAGRSHCPLTIDHRGPELAPGGVIATLLLGVSECSSSLRQLVAPLVQVAPVEHVGVLASRPTLSATHLPLTFPPERRIAWRRALVREGGRARWITRPAGRIDDGDHSLRQSAGRRRERATVISSANRLSRHPQYQPHQYQPRLILAPSISS